MVDLTNNIREIYQPFYQFLTVDGVETSVFDTNNDYSVVSEDFYIKPDSADALVLLNFNLYIQDNNKFKANGYGSMDPLTNGIRMMKSKGNDLTTNVLSEFTISKNVKTHGDWSQFGAQLNHIDFGVGDDFINVRFKFTMPILVNGKNDELFGLVLNDDFSPLVTHTIFISGVKFKR